VVNWREERKAIVCRKVKMPEGSVNRDDILMTYVDKMIAMKGDKLSVGEERRLREELFERLNSQVDEEMISALPDETVLELDRKMKEGVDEKEIEEILENSGVDFQQAVMRAMEVIAADYFAGVVTMANETNVGEER